MAGFEGWYWWKSASPHIGHALLAQKLCMIGYIEDGDAKRPRHGFELGFRARPPHPMSGDHHGTLGTADDAQQAVEFRRIGPCARCRTGGARPGAFFAAGILVEGREHDVDGQADMYRPGIPGCCRLPCAVHELADAFAIGDPGGILHQGCGDGHVVDFLETACALPFQSGRPGHENDRRAFASCLKHGRHGIRESLGSNQADSGLSRDPRVPVGKVTRDLLVRAVDHRHLAFHESLQRRIAEAASQGEDMIHALFLERARQQCTPSNSMCLPHVAVELLFGLCRHSERPRRARGPVTQFAAMLEQNVCPQTFDGADPELGKGDVGILQKELQ